MDSAAVTAQMSTSEWADSTAAGVISTSSMKHTKETSLGNNEGELADAAASKRKKQQRMIRNSLMLQLTHSPLYQLH